MKLFIDTADIEEAQRATALGVISGATTNPKLAAAAGPGNFAVRVKEILACCPGPVSVEVVADTVDAMLEEAAEYSALDPRIVVKIPMTLEGVEVIHKLERERDIRVNVTCMMNSTQALMAMIAGASYVSLFVGRINDLGNDSDSAISETAEFIERGGFATSIIAGSIRQVGDISRAFLAGAHIVTIPYKFLPQMAHHPRTSETIQEFKEAWDEALRKGELS